MWQTLTLYKGHTLSVEPSAPRDIMMISSDDLRLPYIHIKVP